MIYDPYLNTEQCSYRSPQALCVNGGVATVDLAVQALASSTQGYSGADLSNLCQEAALMAARQDLHGASHVAAEHFEAALLHLQPSVGNLHAMAT